MALTFASLLVVPTADEIEQDMLDILDTAGFPVDAWQPGSIPLTIIESVAQALYEVWLKVQEFAAGAYLDTATNGWLTLLAEQAFNVTRSAATATTGTVVLTDAGGGPHTITAGQLRVSNAAGTRIYTNTTGGTLGLNDTLSVTVQAEETGAAYNLTNGDITVLITSLPAVTVANPDPGTGTWITAAGADEQSDESLRQECRAQWGTLAMGVAASAYVAWAKAAEPLVTRVKVDDANPDGPGTVRVTVAGAAGPLGTDEVTTVDTYLQLRKAIGTSTLSVQSATASVITVTGTVTVETAQSAAAQTTISSNLSALAASKAIGEAVSPSELYEAIMTVDGVKKVTLSAPAAETSVGAEGVPTFTNNLSYTTV